VACGPDHKPDQPCDGPSFNLVLRTETGDALPTDTHINVRYGGNQDGEQYRLGKPRTPQAVFCTEDTSAGGATSGDVGSGSGAGGAPAAAPANDDGVQALRCRLYTQGPARLDATASGYEPIDDLPLSFETKLHCNVDLEVKLAPEKPDASM
jgi:hypothetical protein